MLQKDEILVELDGNSKNPAGSRAGIELSLKSLTNALESAKRVSANLNKIYKRDKNALQKQSHIKADPGSFRKQMA